jgi:thiamine-phosphate pyrophosphorylase
MASALRVVLVTDGAGDVARVKAIVRASAAGGVRAVQVREPGLGARQLAGLCEALRADLAPIGGLVLVNDRADVAAAGHADGVHLGHRSLEPARVRRFLPPPALVGFSAHSPAEIEVAAAAGVDYVSLSPVFATPSKPAAVPIGVERATAWTRAAPVPVVWLGGIDRDALDALPRSVPAGVAVMRALCAAPDVERAATELCRAFARRAAVD